MIRTPQLWAKFYENLAFLFYSICYCDGKIEEKESVEVRSLLQKVWLEFDPPIGAYDHETAYRVGEIFDWLSEIKPTAASTFKRFNDFVRNYPRFIDQRLAENIFRSANQIATAHAGRNKMELGYLYLLQELLDKAKKMNPCPPN
ncbi:TerB family tellurite resistance protein [Olivibacter sp. SDN3]|uniref:TerB family tellurite resistance protein n=1 Tax=Olivibacter sp. SDN3 TaxID=2764720 RepID=UPI0016516BD0|nr:TerB family tellurite resistance protein [Olivibacter sp. SDN3]QNL52003.1 TerB family tellurite resistance protein [Olivibacter sp. SDN3]